MEHDLPVALETTAPFLRRDALRAGIPRAVLEGRRFRAVGHGVLVAAGVPDSPALRLRAALTTLPPTAFGSHDSAARVWDAPVATGPDEHVTVLRREDRRRRRGRVCHVERGPEAEEGPDVVVRQGVRVSSLTRLFTEMAERLPLVELVVLGDWMVRRRGVTPGAIRAAADRLPGERGRRAREAAAYVRPKVDSPMETRLRMLLVLAGLPEPEVNLEIRAEDGELLRRYDLSWPSARVVVEYAGRVHRATDEQWEKDLRRREDSDDEGWRMLVVVSSGIYRDPGETVARVRRLLRARGLSGLPSSPSDAWRPHFPGRDA